MPATSAGMTKLSWSASLRLRRLGFHQFDRFRIERLGFMQRLAQRLRLHPSRVAEVAAGHDAFGLLQGKALEVALADIIRHLDGAFMRQPKPLQRRASEFDRGLEGLPHLEIDA